MIPIINRIPRRYLHTSSLRKTKPQDLPHIDPETEGAFKLWRSLLIFAAVPAIMLCGINCVIKHKEEAGHRPKFIKYDYLRIRTKRFPWGDGTKSLFHNPQINALPDGYEDVAAPN